MNIKIYFHNDILLLIFSSIYKNQGCFKLIPIIILYQKEYVMEHDSLYFCINRLYHWWVLFH